MTSEERELIAWLVSCVEYLDDSLFAIAQRHRALLEILVAKGLITKPELTKAIAGREAARAVDEALDPKAVEFKQKLQEVKRLLLGETE